MKQTNKLRFVERTTQVFLNEDTYTYRKLRILQQWWEGFGSDTAINYAHPDAHRLSKNPPGEWRDVPIEVEA